MILLSRRSIGALMGAALLSPPLLLTARAQRVPAVHRIEIRRFAFQPESLTVAPGDRVEWINRDLAPHTATGRNGDWDTGELQKDAGGSIVFSDTGRFDYFCAFHPHMTGEILVEG